MRWTHTATFKMGVFPSVDSFVNCRFLLIRVTAVLVWSSSLSPGQSAALLIFVSEEWYLEKSLYLHSDWKQMGKAMWLLRLTSVSPRDGCLIHVSQGRTNTWKVHPTESSKKTNFFNGTLIVSVLPPLVLFRHVFWKSSPQWCLRKCLCYCPTD